MPSFESTVGAVSVLGVMAAFAAGRAAARGANPCSFAPLAESAAASTFSYSSAVQEMGQHFAEASRQSWAMQDAIDASEATRREWAEKTDLALSVAAKRSR